MITCGNCAAQYQLDEVKIPDEGARVRCSECDHSFLVESPDRSDAHRIEELAREATLESAEADGDPEADFSHDFEIEGEADWEFNDSGEPAPEPPAEPAPEAEALMLESEHSPALVEEEYDEIGDAEEIVENSSESAPVEDISQDLAGELEELEDPASWDIFDTDPATAPAEASSAVPAEASSGEESVEGALTEPQVGLSVGVAGAGDSRRLKHGVRVASIVGYAGVALLLALGLYGGLVPPSHAIAGSSGSWSDAGFEVEGLEGRWVDNVVAGPIYVVDGRMRWAGNFRTWRAPALGIRLLDAQGRILEGQKFAIGPAISDRVLQESDPFKLAIQQGQRAASHAASAEGWQPFNAVAAGISDAARRYELEATAAANADGADHPLMGPPPPALSVPDVPEPLREPAGPTTD